MCDGRQQNAAKARRSTALMRWAFLPAFAVLIGVGAHSPARAIEPSNGGEVGSIWWTELRARDLRKTEAFYASVFGWTPKVVAQNDMSRPPSTGEQGYTVFHAGDREVAGAEEIRPEDTTVARPGWLTYVQVADVDEAVRKAIENGGKIVQLPSDVPTVGRMAEIEDPEGNRVGLVSPSK